MAGKGAPKGNQYAAKAKEFEGALKRALVRADGSLNRIADKLVEQAEAGEQWAVQMVADRLDGKPKQQTEITGADDGPLSIRHIISEKPLDMAQWAQQHNKE